MTDSSNTSSGTVQDEVEIQDFSASEYVNKRYQNWGLKYHSYVIRSMLGEKLEGKILDVGCGTGIVHDLYPNADIVGIDISDGMLKHHKGKWIKAPVENVPFKDNYFDLVVCRSTLHHLPDAVAGLREIKRVLKPGGKVVMWETNQSWLAEKVREITQHGDRFSHFHHSFSDLPFTVSAHFNIEEIKYEGFVAYALYGFPDIRDFSRIFGRQYLFDKLIALDEFFSKVPIIKNMGFAIRIMAVKNA